MLKSKLYNNLLLATFFSFGAGLSASAQLSVFTIISLILIILNFSILLLYPKPIQLLPGNKSGIFVKLILVIVFYTMLYRGIGFEKLGSNKSGGMFYVELFVVLLFFICLVRVSLTHRFISVLFLSFSLAFVLPLLSDIIYLFSGDTFIKQIVPGSSTIKYYADNADFLLRIESGAPLAESLLGLMLVYEPLFTNNGKLRLTKLNIAAMLTILILIGISGHRSTLISIALITIFYYYHLFGSKKIVRPVLYGLGLFILISLLAIVSFDHLPSNFQRVFSFLPFTPSNDISMEAGDSLTFRLLMVAKAYTMLPDYYLIGKGFAFVNENVDMSDYLGTINQFSEIGVFHNGVIGLLINLGLPGLVVGLALIGSLFKTAKHRISYNNVGVTQRIFTVLKCKIMFVIISFVFLYGDVQTNFIELMVLATFYTLTSSYLYQNSISGK